MKYDVFISYARKDYADEHKNVIPDNVISKIKDFLKENGYSYWFDEDGIYSGDEFVGVITEAIMNSEVFLFASSEASNNSEWTSHEIAVAKLLKKKTIPFKLDDSVYDKSILMYLAPLDHIEYFANPQKAFSALQASLKIHFSKKEEEKKKKIAEAELEKKKKEEAEARLKAEQNKKQRIATIEKNIANLLVEKQQLQSKKEAKLEQIKEIQEEANYFDVQIKDKEKGIQILEQKKYELAGSPNQESQNENTETGKPSPKAPTWFGGKTTGAFVIGVIATIFILILLLSIMSIK